MSRAWPVRGLDPSASLAENARRILAVRVAEFYSYGPVVADETAITEHHNLRIAAKRLRYTLELFRSVFGECGERQIGRVKQLQEELGMLHDHDVRLGLIQDELAALVAEQTAALGRSLAAAPAAAHQAIATAALRPPPDDPRRGLIALLGRQYASRHRHFEAFVRLWQRFGAEGMRRELVALSSVPIDPVADASRSPNGSGEPTRRADRPAREAESPPDTEPVQRS